MERSISSDNGRDDPDFGIFCFCGEPAPLRRSTTENDPGRRFFGCTKYKTREDCGFFCWYEPSGCLERSDLGPMRVQTRKKAWRTVEKCSVKNRKKKTIMDHSIWGNLRPEIIEHVLSFLPVKFLCQFKCVSPSWNSLISSPSFAKTHRHITNSTPNRPQKILLISGSRELYSVDFAAVKPTAEKLDFGFPVQDPTDEVRGWGSCNGLVLVSTEGTFYNLYLLNPFTREGKKLPDSPLFDCCPYNKDYDDFIANGFGYDSSTDDYKVVMFRYRSMPNGSNSTVAVYSLKTDAWRKIQVPRYDPDLAGHHCRGCFFNERLHWVWVRPVSTDFSVVVVSFDLWDEVFREVDLPTSFASSYNIDDIENLFSVVPGSCLCLVISPLLNPKKEIYVWMMTKYGVRESWTKVTIPNHGMLVEDIFKIPTHGMTVKDVLFLAAKGELLLRMIQEVNGEGVHTGREKLVLYYPKNNTVRDVVVCGIPTEYTVGGSYFETLVFPNHGGRIWRTYEATLG